MTDLYFAWGNFPSINNTLSLMPPKTCALLVSYVFLDAWDNRKPVNGALCEFEGRKMMMDSGAYSAWLRGATVDINALIEETKNSRWDECVALDVIGDAKGSEANAYRMKEAGSPAFPVFHYGEPWDLLKRYCAAFQKVGLSCLFGETPTESYAFINECFQRTWPHKYHSFGWMAKKLLRAYPFHSADSTGWAGAPRYGHWPSLGGNLGIRNPRDLRVEFESQLKFERELKSRWSKELARLSPSI